MKNSCSVKLLGVTSGTQTDRRKGKERNGIHFHLLSAAAGCLISAL